MEISIHSLAPADAPAYRALMLEAYERHPEAFTSTVEERADLPLAFWENRMPEEEHALQTVFGAFDGDSLIGVAGFARAERPRTRHRAKLFGMYVRPEQRGAGVGRALVRNVLHHARQCPGLRVVYLTVTEENHGARKLYERCGFVPFGREPLAVALGSGFLVKIHMSCDLEAPVHSHE